MTVSAQLLYFTTMYQSRKKIIFIYIKYSCISIAVVARHILCTGEGEKNTVANRCASWEPCALGVKLQFFGNRTMENYYFEVTMLLNMYDDQIRHSQVM